MRDDKDNLIVKLTFDFSINIIAFTEELDQLRKYNLSKQLFRSGTSIGANVREAQNAESKNDFIHKLKIAAKEADETEYWLMLCKHSQHYLSPDNLIVQLDSLMKVLNKIISTSKRKDTALIS